MHLFHNIGDIGQHHTFRQFQFQARKIDLMGANDCSNILDEVVLPDIVLPERKLTN